MKIRGTPVVFLFGHLLMGQTAVPSRVAAIAGTPQGVLISHPLPVSLRARVFDASGNPIAGVGVTFSAPASGASGTFAGFGPSVSVMTSAAGVAVAPGFTANGTGGVYTVKATVAGITPATFFLTNIFPSGTLTAAIGPNLPLFGGITVADVNGDGIPDLLSARSTALDVYLGTGTTASPFKPAQTTSVPGNAIQFQAPTPVVADFNNDGIPDVVIVGNGIRPVILLGTGNPSTLFQPGSTVSIPQFDLYDHSPIVGDFNGDGIPDFAASDSEDGGSMAVWYGTGGGQFATPITVSILGFQTALAPVDFNGDGLMDIATSTGEILISTGNPSSPFTVIAPLFGFPDFSSLAVGDVNGDGLPDVAIMPANGGNQPLIYVFINKGGTALALAASIPISNLELVSNFEGAIAIGDVNGDGIADIVALPNGSMLVFPGSGDPQNPFPVTLGKLFPSSIPGITDLPVGLVLADVNGDGRLDTVCICSNSPSVLMGQPAAASISVSANSNPVPVGIADQLTATMQLSQPNFVPFFPGTMSFLDSAAVVGTVAASASGQATLNTSFATVGSHSLTATYAGDPRVAASVSPAVSLTVTPPATTRLVFVSQPQSVTAGAAFNIAVQLRDSQSNNLPIANAVVTLAISSGIGILAGTVVQSTDATGLATFTNLSISIAGTKVLTATSPLLISGSSAPISITPGPAVRLAPFRGNGQAARLGVHFPLSLQAKVMDAKGNGIAGIPVTFTAPVTALGPTGVFDGAVPSPTVSTDANGLATAPGFSAVQAGGGYVVQATASGFAPANFSLNNNTGSGTILTGSMLSDLAQAPTLMADITGDGLPDLVSVDGAGVHVYFATGNGFNPFINAHGSPFAVSNASAGSPFLVADVNGDGLLDIVVAPTGGNTVSVLLGTGNPANWFVPALGSPYMVGGNPAAVATADVNGDGLPDLIVGTQTSSTAGQITVLLGGNSTGATSLFTPAPGPTPSLPGVPDFIAVADVNGDGLPDIAVAVDESALFSPNALELSFNTGNPQALFGAPVRVGGLMGGDVARPVGLFITDLNGDGRPEIVVGDNFGAITIFRASGVPGSFMSVSGGTSTSGLQSVALADINGDGFLDVVGVDSNIAANVVVFAGTGSAAQFFQTPVSIASGGQLIATSVTVGDLNGDGLPDLLLGGASVYPALVLVPGARVPANTTLTFAPNPPFVGQSVTLSAATTVTQATFANLAAGAVFFQDSPPPAGNPSFPLGVSASNAAGQATYTSSNFVAGTHQLSASFSGPGVASNSASASMTVGTIAGTLAFAQPPLSGTAGVTMTPAVTVQLLGTDGVTKIAQAGFPVTLSLSSGSGPLSGTLTQLTNAAGLATFGDLRINASGQKQLTATCPQFGSVSSTFTIQPGPASSLTAIASTIPVSATVGTPFAGILSVTVADSLGNPVAGVPVTFTAPASGASGTYTNGTNTTTAVTGSTGIASATTFTANMTTGQYILSVTAAGVQPLNLALTNTAAATPPGVLAFKVLFGSQSYSVTGSPRVHLPWQISGIQVVFSKPIAGGTTASIGGVTATALGGLGTNTLTWSITPVAQGALTLTLSGSGANALVDGQGNPLGGGAGFSQPLKILWGDFNDDGVVNASDITGVTLAVNAAYNLFADMNGDGVVNIPDVQIVRTRVGTSLP